MFQIENSKQAEFLADIRDVGMSIIVGLATAKDIEKTFVPYAQYIEDERKVMEYFEAIYSLTTHSPTPDDLLLKLGAFTLDITYEDNIYEEEEDCGYF